MSDSSLWNEKYTSAKLAALAVTSGFRIFKVMELIFPLYVETFMLVLVISLRSLWPKGSFHVLITYTCSQTKSGFQCGFSHFTVWKNDSCCARILTTSLFMWDYTAFWSFALPSYILTQYLTVCSLQFSTVYLLPKPCYRRSSRKSYKSHKSYKPFELSVSIYWRNKILFQFCKGETMAWNDMCVCVLIINKRSKFSNLHSLLSFFYF